MIGTARQMYHELSPETAEFIDFMIESDVLKFGEFTLKSGRKSAGEISDHFDITAAAISRHLSVLKEADLIDDTRDGKYIFYELNSSVLEEIMLWITDLKGESV